MIYSIIKSLYVDKYKVEVKGRLLLLFCVITGGVLWQY